MYVPSPETVNVVALQFGTTDSSIDGVAGSFAPHNFTVVATNGKSAAPFVSLATGVYVWFVSYASVIASGDAVGTGGAPTVGVIVEVATRLNVSVT